MTTLCLNCHKKMSDNSSGLCFFCRHKEFLRSQGITNCDCYMCLREKGLLKEKVLEESMKELDPSFDQELYRKILRKHQKRKARHSELTYDPRKEAMKEYLEIQKQIKTVTDKPMMTTQTHLVTEQPQQEQPQEMDIGRRMYLQDLAQDEPPPTPRTISLWKEKKDE